MARGKPQEKGFIVKIGKTHVLVFATSKNGAIKLATSELGIDARLATHKELFDAGKDGAEVVQEKAA